MKSELFNGETLNILPGCVCRIEIEEAWRPASQGLDACSKVEVIYWMDRARRDLLVQVPGGGGGPAGTFVLRSPARPNMLPETQTAGARSAARPMQSLAHAAAILDKIVSEMESDDGWVNLGEAGQQLANLAPDFDPRTYGVKKLSDLVRKIDALELERSPSGHLRIRPKPAVTGKAAKPR